MVEDTSGRKRETRHKGRGGREPEVAGHRSIAEVATGCGVDGARRPRIGRRGRVELCSSLCVGVAVQEEDEGERGDRSRGARVG